MRVMAKIWLFVLLLTLVMGGCQRSPGEAERRLMAIDSLIAAHPDSALALLAQVDTATLDEPDRAYHALLQTQAMYKAGVPVDDSTLIFRAQRYYAGHGPVDRQIRTMRYRASVAEDLGDPELAMRWYKRTELAAREHGDDFNTGYALMSMGVLYMSKHDDSLALCRFREAVGVIPSSKKRWVMYCTQQLSQLYLGDGRPIDSAEYYINMTRNLATSLNDSDALATASATMVMKHFYSKDFSKAKTAAVSTINSFGDLVHYNCWIMASQSFAKLGQVDSAEYYLQHAPEPIYVSDSVMRLHSLALISELRGRWKDAHNYEILSDKIADEELLFNSSQPLALAENSVIEQSVVERNSSRSKRMSRELNLELLKSQEAINRLSQKQIEAEIVDAETSSDIERLNDDTECISDANLSEAQSEQIKQAVIDERDRAKQLISSHIGKMQRIIDAIPLMGDYVAKLHNEIIFDTLEKEFWLSDASLDFIAPSSRAFYEQIAAKCQLTDVEMIILKLVAMDFSDDQIRILMGSKRVEYARGVLSRIKRKYGIEYSIRKTFRKLNSANGTN